MESSGLPVKKSLGKILAKDFITNRYVYLLAVPVVLYYIIFKYIPMYGAVIAFKNFSPGRGIWGSPWVGMQNFIDFFESVYFFRLIRNTFTINLLNLLFGFPAPIILALLINEVRNVGYKKLVQTITYMPHFVSLVVIAGIVLDFTSLNGFINDIAEFIMGVRIPFMTNNHYFKPIYVISDIWQHMGFNSIIFIAAIIGLDQELYEAATIDGAGRFKQAFHITIPGIMPTIIIMLILRIGNMMSLGFEKIVLLYNPSIYESADVISSYVYRRGLLEFGYSFSTAVGLFNSVINFILLVMANKLSVKVQDTGLW